MATISEALTVAQQYQQAGHLREAEQIYRQIVQADPAHAEAWFYLSLVCASEHRFDEAFEYCRQATAIRPDSARIRHMLGLIQEGQGNLDGAIHTYQEALRLQSDDVEAQHNLGMAFTQRGRLEEAEAAYRRVLQLDPNHAPAHCNLAMVLTGRGQLDEAVATYRQALRIRPDYAIASSNLGLTFVQQGKVHEAVECFQQAIRLDPNFAEAHRNLAHAWLSLGNFEQGWPMLEWRWRCGGLTEFPFKQPIWDGSSLTGKTTLLHAEQGLGDSIQFVRFAPLVKKLGGKVIVGCPEKLVSLLTTCPGVDQTLSAVSDSIPFDVHLSFLSLPRVLKITLDTLPAKVPYLFPVPELVQKWREIVDKETRRQGDKERHESTESGPARHHSPLTTHHSPLTTHHSPLTTHHSPLKIGIAWQGRPAHVADGIRSVSLKQFSSLAQLEGLQLFSLQKGAGSEQLEEVGDEFPIIDLGSRIENWMDTAAALMSLDLVISVDTGLVHCAGALGRPVWVALSYGPDWRWLLEREDSPWYPTMRLFRQKRWGDWDEVFERIAREVQHLVKQRTSG